MSPLASSVPCQVAPRRRMRRGAALWFNASVMIAFLAASTAPSPLYALYRDAWGFSALTLTAVFAVYAIALLGALIVFGGLSDHRGRREVLTIGLAIEIVAVLVFWQAQSVAWLFAARALQGLATGIATSALSAGLLDLDRERGALLNSVAPLVGMAVGALGTGALAEFAPAPTRLVYVLLLAVFAAQAIAARHLPETVTKQPGALASLRPKLVVPPRARATLWQVLPVNTATWALGGFYASLGPTLGRVVTGLHSATLGGGVVASLVLSGAVAIVLVRTRPPRVALAAGAGALAVGIVVTLAGVQTSSTALFFAGSVVAGLGFGAAFNGSVRSVVPLAEPHERAGLMSTYYAVSYLAFSLPAMVAGVSSGRVGLVPTALGYGVVLVVMAAAALVAMALRRSRA